MNPTSMPKPQQNKRETGARKYPASRQQAAETDTHAGMPTANPFGLTQPRGRDDRRRRGNPTASIRQAWHDDAGAAPTKVRSFPLLNSRWQARGGTRLASERVPARASIYLLRRRNIPSALIYESPEPDDCPGHCDATH